MPKRMLVKRSHWLDEGEEGSEASGVNVPQIIELKAPKVEPWRLAAPEQRRAPHMVWQDVLHAGTVTLLYSIPKHGKSFVTMGLVAAMTTGREFLGRPTAHTGVVLVSEENPEIMNRRIDLFKADAGKIGYFFRFDPQLRNWSFEDVMANAAAVAVRDGRRLLVIDTLIAWTHGEYNVELDPEQARVFFGYLRALAQQYGFAVLVLHHSKKRSIEMRGWTALRGCLDTVIRLEAPDEESSHRILHCTSHLAGVPERIDFDYSRFAGFEELETLSAEEAVWRRLPAGGKGVSADELVTRTGFKRTVVYEILGAMIDEERVRMVGEGKKGSPWRYCRVG